MVRRIEKFARAAMERQRQFYGDVEPLASSGIKKRDTDQAHASHSLVSICSKTDAGRPDKRCNIACMRGIKCLMEGTGTANSLNSERCPDLRLVAPNGLAKFNPFDHRASRRILDRPWQLHSIRSFFDAINAYAGIKPVEPIGLYNKGQPARPVTPTPRYETADPSALIKQGAKAATDWIAGNWTKFTGPVHRPVTPTPSVVLPALPVPPPRPWETLPTFLPPARGQPSQPVAPPTKPWEAMPKFSQLLPQANDNGLISKASFNPGAPAEGQAAASSSRGDAIAIIAAGTRRGVLDGMTDFWQMMKGLKERVGLTNASYETGASASGSAAGGRGDGSGGEGAGGSRAGAGGVRGGPAAAIGRAVRRQAHGSESGGDSAVAPPGPPGTYRPQYSLGPKDLSDKVVATVAGEASTRNPAAQRSARRAWLPVGQALRPRVGLRRTIPFLVPKGSRNGSAIGRTPQPSGLSTNNWPRPRGS